MKESAISLPRSATDPLRVLLATFPATQDNLLPILHAVQDLYGFIPPDRVADIAHALNISRAEVHGVITYYHHFRTAPVRAQHVQICRAEACQSMGAERLFAHANTLSQAAEQNSNGNITVEAIYCLGLCASSPALLLNEVPHGRVTPESLHALLSSSRGDQ